jgi:hypothetical protein
MELSELKKKIRHRSSVDVKDIEPIIEIFRSDAKAEGYQAFEVSSLKDAKSTLQNVGQFLKA